MRGARLILRCGLLALLFPLISGCASVAEAPLLRAFIGRAPEPPADLAEMQARAAATGARLMVLRLLERDLATTLLYVEERDGVAVWRTADNVRLYTRGGLLIATRGLGDDLMSVDAAETLPMITQAAHGETRRINRRLDGNDETAIHGYLCEITPQGRERVQTGDTTFVEATRVEETCYSPRETLLNIYWVENGRIRKSHQNFSPLLGPLDILFLP